jgi:hypothetical protein
MTQQDAPIWKKPEKDKVFWDGEKFLVAVLVHSFYGGIKKVAYEYHVIRVSCDSECPVSFVYDESDQPFDQWDWEDFDWYISINHNDVAGDDKE